MKGDLSRQASAWFLQLDDEPDNESLRAEFMDWRATSPAHLAAWEETVRVSDLISVAGPLPRNAPIIESELPRHGWFRRMSSTRTLASLALAACLAWAVVPDLSLQLRSDEITTTAELRVVRLEDGSTLHLAPRTAIAFSNDAKGRTLSLLQGEAWFDVAHDTARPFRVLAGESTVTVLGTAFSVRRTDRGTDVAVQCGHVAVTMPHGPGDAGRIPHEDRRCLQERRVGLLADRLCQRGLASSAQPHAGCRPHLRRTAPGFHA